MRVYLLLRALFISVGFAGWPIVGNFSKASGAWVGTIVLGTTGVVIALLSSRGLISNPLPSYKSIVYLVVAGVINGLACYVYSLTTVDKNIQIGLFVSLVSILMVVIAPLMSWLLNGEIISSKQIVGLFLACVSIYLLVN